MNEVSEKFVIQLRIDNQTYPIKIRRDEEEIYRAAERKINDKLNLYKEHFPNLEEERYMFMAMLDLSVQLIRSEKRNDTGNRVDISIRITYLFAIHICLFFFFSRYTMP